MLERTAPERSVYSAKQYKEAMKGWKGKSKLQRRQEGMKCWRRGKYCGRGKYVSCKRVLRGQEGRSLNVEEIAQRWSSYAVYLKKCSDRSSRVSAFNCGRLSEYVGFANKLNMKKESSEVTSIICLLGSLERVST
jgi:hypothetical protein